MYKEASENSRSNPPKFQIQRNINVYNETKRTASYNEVHCSIKTCTFSLWNIFKNCLSTRFSNSKHLASWILEVRNGTLLQLKEKAKLRLTEGYSPYWYVITVRFITELGWYLCSSTRFIKKPSFILK